MNETNENVELETVVIEFPVSVPIAGTRKMLGTLDYSKATSETITRLIEVAAKELTRRAAGEDKPVAEKEVFDLILSFAWTPGATSERQDAERAILAQLFQSAGISVSLAEKRAKKSDAWTDYTRLALARTRNTGNISQEDIVIALEANQTAIKAMVDAEIIARKARMEQLQSGLSF